MKGGRLRIATGIDGKASENGKWRTGGRGGPKNGSGKIGSSSGVGGGGGGGGKVGNTEASICCCINAIEVVGPP